MTSSRPCILLSGDPVAAGSAGALTAPVDAQAARAGSVDNMMSLRIMSVAFFRSNFTFLVNQVGSHSGS